MKKLICNEVARYQSASLQKKTLSQIFFHVFCLHFLRMHHDYVFRKRFESVRAQFLSEVISVTFNFPVQLRFIQDNLSQSKSSCWIWHVTYSWVQFLSNILEFFVFWNIKLVTLCFDRHTGKVGPETRDLRPGTHTWDSGPGTLHPRSGTLHVGNRTQYLYMKGRTHT